MLTPEARSTCEPCCSAGNAIPTPTTNSTSIAARTATAWRRASTIFPNMKTWPAGISRIAITSRKFVIPFGFSNGTAEFEL